MPTSIMRVNRGLCNVLAIVAVSLAAAGSSFCDRRPAADATGPQSTTPAARADAPLQTRAPTSARGGPGVPDAAHKPSPVPLTVSRGARAARPSVPAAPAAPGPATRPPSLGAIEAEIIRLTNVERAAEGLPPLAVDAALGAIARAHSRDMVERDYFSHENQLGEGPDERATKAGYNIRRPGEGSDEVGVGENIGQVLIGLVEDEEFVAQDAGSIAAAQVRYWMDSRGHRGNILSEDYRRVGVGVAYDGKRLYISTQVFW